MPSTRVGRGNMVEPEISEAERLRHEQDIEKKRNQELQDLIEENLQHEKCTCPGFQTSDTPHFIFSSFSSN